MRKHMVEVVTTRTPNKATTLINVNKNPKEVGSDFRQNETKIEAGRLIFDSKDFKSNLIFNLKDGKIVTVKDGKYALATIEGSDQQVAVCLKPDYSRGASRGDVFEVVLGNWSSDNKLEDVKLDLSELETHFRGAEPEQAEQLVGSTAIFTEGTTAVVPQQAVSPEVLAQNLSQLGESVNLFMQDGKYVLSGSHGCVHVAPGMMPTILSWVKINSSIQISEYGQAPTEKIPPKLQPANFQVSPEKVSLAIYPQTGKVKGGIAIVYYEGKAVGSFKVTCGPRKTWVDEHGNPATPTKAVSTKVKTVGPHISNLYDCSKVPGGAKVTVHPKGVLSGEPKVMVSVTTKKIAITDLAKLGDKQAAVWAALVKEGYIDQQGVEQPKYFRWGSTLKLGIPLSETEKIDLAGILKSSKPGKEVKVPTIYYWGTNPKGKETWIATNTKFMQYWFDRGQINSSGFLNAPDSSFESRQVQGEQVTYYTGSVFGNGEIDPSGQRTVGQTIRWGTGEAIHVGEGDEKDAGLCRYFAQFYITNNPGNKTPEDFLKSYYPTFFQNLSNGQGRKETVIAYLSSITELRGAILKQGHSLGLSFDDLNKVTGMFLKGYSVAGKQMLTEYITQRSLRKDGAKPLLTIDPKTLIPKETGKTIGIEIDGLSVRVRDSSRKLDSKRTFHQLTLFITSPADLSPADFYKLMITLATKLQINDQLPATLEDFKRIASAGTFKVPRSFGQEESYSFRLKVEVTTYD